MLLLDHRGQRLRGRKRVGVGPGWIVEVDRAIAAHGERRAQRLLHPIRAQRHGDDLALATLFLDAQRFLDRELVVGRDDPGDAGGVDGLGVGTADLDLRRGVRHLFDGDDDLHEVAPRSECS